VLKKSHQASETVYQHNDAQSSGFFMKMFKPSHYFDLHHFEHAQIFNNCEFVWEILPHIEEYLLTLPLGHIEVEIPPGVVLIDRHLISIAKGTVVEPGSYIKGPCVIGENSSVRQGAYIRGNFLCGKKCVIGHTTEVKNAVFLDNAHAAHFAYIGDTILGNHTNLGAGTKCANLRFDNESIRILIDGKVIDTGLRKFGAIFGDHSQSGCNSVTNPGTLIGKRACIYPCTNAKGIIPEGYAYHMDGSLVESHTPKVT